jgi:hypothetical protein
MPIKNIYNLKKGKKMELRSKKKMADRVAQVVEYFPSKYEALGSNHPPQRKGS